MTQGLPEDLFRPGTDDEEPAQESTESVPPHEEPQPPPPSVKTVPFERRGVSPRVLAGVLLAAFLLAFAAGRLFLFRPEPPVVTLTPEHSASASVSPTGTPSELVAYSGPVVTVPALTAEASCSGDVMPGTASNLLDNDPASIWRCTGDGVDEQLRFTFSGLRPLVGVRVVNGNTAWTDRYLGERRILALRWEFDDGSYFVQGLAADNRNPQEVRFPPLTATAVTVTVLEVTAPGDASPDSDAVSISAIEFLSPA